MTRHEFTEQTLCSYPPNAVQLFSKTQRTFERPFKRDVGRLATWGRSALRRRRAWQPQYRCAFRFQELGELHGHLFPAWRFVTYLRGSNALVESVYGRLSRKTLSKEDSSTRLLFNTTRGFKNGRILCVETLRRAGSSRTRACRLFCIFLYLFAFRRKRGSQSLAFRRARLPVV